MQDFGGCLRWQGLILSVVWPCGKGPQYWDKKEAYQKIQQQKERTNRVLDEADDQCD